MNSKLSKSSSKDLAKSPGTDSLFKLLTVNSAFSSYQPRNIIRALVHQQVAIDLPRSLIKADYAVPDASDEVSRLSLSLGRRCSTVVPIMEVVFTVPLYIRVNGARLSSSAK